eukprot:CAMPEP_0203816438 /NCGR_PEP_ID=MMETSP0115-20131106/15068_1 /ASSEMBLY_ACC=CAM_ASM_000227 /TAXON_ID=33651 /ORGANISM="Bicosoecid sp, Strain ms1" /LENGTH=90 /DNA_ID=CAMNT_0050725343 /DNA_START=28 /DNA_END=300 /DNA_ORIENTATION=+
MSQKTYAEKVSPTLFKDTATLASVRCRRRWADYQLLLADLRDGDSKVSRLLSKEEQRDVVTERYWLFQKCLASKPGTEPKQTPFLYNATA